jgi:hypothetical protein
LSSRCNRLTSWPLQPTVRTVVQPAGAVVVEVVAMVVTNVDEDAVVPESVEPPPHAAPATTTIPTTEPTSRPGWRRPRLTRRLVAFVLRGVALPASSLSDTQEWLPSRARSHFPKAKL